MSIDEHRAVPAGLAVSKLADATPLVNRFFGPEWVILTQASPTDFLTPAYTVHSHEEDGVTFFHNYRDFMWKSLLRLVRVAVCLVNNTSPMVDPTNGCYSFDDEFNPARFNLIGMMDESCKFPNANSDEKTNPLAGTFTQEEAISRAEAISRQGQKVIELLNQAYDKFGHTLDPSNTWDFDQALRSADNHHFNATIPGAALLVNNKTWDFLRDPKSNFVEEVIRSGNTLQKIQNPITAPSPQSSELSEEDDLTRPSPPIRACMVGKVPIPDMEDYDSPHYQPPSGIYSPLCYLPNEVRNYHSAIHTPNPYPVNPEDIRQRLKDIKLKL